MPVICPKCHGQVADGAKFCGACGAAIEPVPEAAEQNPAAPPGKKRKSKKWLGIGIGIGVLAAVVCVAALAVILTHKGGGSNGGGDNSGGSNSSGGGSSSKSSNYIFYQKDGELYAVIPGGEPWRVTSGSAGSGYAGAFGTVKVCENNRIFYPDKYEAYYSTSLYWRDVVDREAAPVRIASEVSQFYVNDAGTKVIYITTRKALYAYDVKSAEKEKIADNANLEAVSDDLKTVVYEDVENDAYYRYTSEGEKEKIDSDIERIFFRNDNKIAWYLKDGVLYTCSLEDGEKEKIASDVTSIYAAYDSGKAYYAKEDESGDTSLWFYNGKEETCLSEDFSRATTCYDAPVMLFMDWEEESLMLAAEGTVSVLENSIENAYIFYITSRSGSDIYYLNIGRGDLYAGHFDYYDVYKAKISGSKISSCDEFETGVSDFCGMLKDDSLVYLKDSDELYVDKTRVSYDVTSYQVAIREDSNQLLFFTDWSNGSGGTLNVYNKGETRKVGDDVVDAVFLPNGDTLYLKDVRSLVEEGNLYLFNGEESQLIEEDVQFVVNY